MRTTALGAAVLGLALLLPGCGSAAPPARPPAPSTATPASTTPAAPPSPAITGGNPPVMAYSAVAGCYDNGQFVAAVQHGHLAYCRMPGPGGSIVIKVTVRNNSRDLLTLPQIAVDSWNWAGDEIGAQVVGPPVIALAPGRSASELVDGEVPGTVRVTATSQP